jgi:hypothetical protein
MSCTRNPAWHKHVGKIGNSVLDALRGQNSRVCTTSRNTSRVQVAACDAGRLPIRYGVPSLFVVQQEKGSVTHR